MGEHNFGYGDQLVVTKDISGAPAGTKAQFMEAIGRTAARVKIIDRKPERAGNDVCYARGAKVTIPFNYLAPDDGRFEAYQSQKRKDVAWRPAYIQPTPPG